MQHLSAVEAAIAEVQAGVRIEATDRAGLERLRPYCARPPFAMARLKQRGADLVYRCRKDHAAPLQSDKYSGEFGIYAQLLFGFW